MVMKLLSHLSMGGFWPSHVLAEAGPWVQTLGRLHVAVVHLPVALLLVAGVIELWRLLRAQSWRGLPGRAHKANEHGPAARATQAPSGTAVTCIVLGAMSAVVASATGWIHRDSSGGSSITLARHQWLGLITAGLAVVALLPLLWRRTAGRWTLGLYRLGAVTCAVLVAVTAHFGGALTHGDGYLTELIFTGKHAGPAHDDVIAIEHSAAQPIADLSAVHFPTNGQVDYQRDVRPILSQACYECHGPLKRRGQLRLDVKAPALKGGKSGIAIVACDSDKSPLVRRVLGLDNLKRMPVDHPPLADEHVRILRAWIDQGAKWPDGGAPPNPDDEKHWAFVKPARPAVPAVKNTAWPRNPIDNFVLARLEKEGLEPSPEAGRATLIRRLYLDLIGLPPTPAEVDAFAADDRADAYEQLVNRLLASPHYGERWGRHWLDVARYADTNGYEKDMPRSIWPYRDWVIHALNRDIGFDQFVIDQMAGDMLPGATDDERIASGFHRNAMLNEEGGIDVEEFRFKSIVDRVQVTSTAFLGLTMQCAQCHDHKYDPLSQKEYYQFFAILNNADEPVIKVPDASIAAARKAAEEQIANMESELPAKFPTHEQKLAWVVLRPDRVTTANGAVATMKQDGSVLVGGPVAEKETYTIDLAADLYDVAAFRVEALTDSSLPKNGPGRAENGNFVISELRIARTPAGAPSPIPVALHDASADFSQPQFEAAKLIDGDPNTGWAVGTGPATNKDHAATVRVKGGPLKSHGVERVTVTLEQNFPKHSIGQFRILAARALMPPPTTLPAERQRERFLATKEAEWETATTEKCAHWTVLDPVKFSRLHDATITKLPDDSLLFTGDNFYRDDYQIEFDADVADIRAIKIEVLPHEELPKDGPGRNANGGFQLTELTVNAVAIDAASVVAATPASPSRGGDAGVAATKEKPSTQPTRLVLINPTADASPETDAQAIDGRPDLHRKVPAGEDTPKSAVFQIRSGLHGFDGGTRLAVNISQNFFSAECLGRVRVSVTPDADARASGVPAEIEQILLTPPPQRTADQTAAVRRQFLLSTPLLATEQRAIKAARAALPELPTTLVMRERSKPRVTQVHHRGEYTEPTDVVQPNAPHVLPPMPTSEPHDRLALARWLVSSDNPLIGRVTMNRIWAQYFGRGIVPTIDDFGTMGEPPSHPELLDWLATELPRQGWSLKQMHRLIVTSATYRQSSRVTPKLMEKDPTNALLARMPRLRVESEIVRDIAMTASGLLSDRISGPSVFPPQPPNISEAAYTPFPWPTSTGPDRYRRGMYTHIKRSAPYPAHLTFDGTSAETICTRRNRSNTPLQALTTLNDTVYVEAAQAMARRVMKDLPTEDCAARARYAMRLCVGREPADDEVSRIVAFHDAQLARFRQKGTDPVAIALAEKAPPPEDVDVNELAAWTTVCRAVLNLDETITRE